MPDTTKVGRAFQNSVFISNKVKKKNNKNTNFSGNKAANGMLTEPCKQTVSLDLLVLTEALNNPKPEMDCERWWNWTGLAQSAHISKKVLRSFQLHILQLRDEYTHG